MPNPDNITRPITLVSYGRSGTSLVHRVLGSHPQVDACGETQPLIFGTWEATSRVRNVIRPDTHLPKGVDFDERCAKAVRAVFLAHFDAPGKPRWAHKPINLPYTFDRRQKENPRRMARAIESYWPIMNACFPEATAITVLRHPYDVALSAQAYWGHPIERIWRHMVRMACVCSPRICATSCAWRKSSTTPTARSVSPSATRACRRIRSPRSRGCWIMSGSTTTRPASPRPARSM